MLVTLLYGFVFAVVKLAVAAPASTGQLAPRATRLAFVGCSPGNQVGDVLVTPPSPDGCAYGCSMRGGGYNYAFSYYQVSSNTCVCSQHPPQASDYTSPCTTTDWSIYSLTTEFSHTGCKASIDGTPSTGVNVPHLPWCFDYCANSNYMYFTPTSGGVFNCYCDNQDFGEGDAECPAALDVSFGEGAGYYYSK